jgi:DNA-directed RNA polymerase specialized sigma24 family protein
MIDESQIDQIAIGSVQTIAVRRIGEADRDDLIQEARIRVWQALDKIDPQRPASEARGYLFVAGRSAAIEFLRWRQRYSRREFLIPALDVLANPRGDKDRPANEAPQPSFDPEVIFAREDPPASDDEELMTILHRARLSMDEMEIVLDRLGRVQMSDLLQAAPSGWKHDQVRSARRKIRRVLEAMHKAKR